ncbi:hypothetical protein B0H11DRAFT_19788 [Mycena galericulata]|nr:hypothetical protein B0H11DRAFT_19788 [Mycena galericulata]
MSCGALQGTRKNGDGDGRPVEENQAESIARLCMQTVILGNLFPCYPKRNGKMSLARDDRDSNSMNEEFPRVSLSCTGSGCESPVCTPAPATAPRTAQVNVNPTPRPSAAALRAGAARGRAPSRSFARALGLKDVSFARFEAVGGGVPRVCRLCAMHHAPASAMDDASLPSSTALPEPAAIRLASIRHA